MRTQFRLLDAARSVVDDINGLLGDRSLRLMHRAQLRDSAQGIASNIREGMGKLPGPDRVKSYRIACGEAEETDEHLRANFAAHRIRPPDYYRIHNRIVAITKMIGAVSDIM